MYVPVLLPRVHAAFQAAVQAIEVWPAGDVSNSSLSLLEAPCASVQVHLACHSHHFTHLLQDIDHERRHQVDEDEQAVGDVE